MTLTGFEVIAGKTWHQEMIEVMVAQRAPRGVGSRQEAQRMERDFTHRVGQAYEDKFGTKFVSLYEAVKRLDEEE